MKTRSKTEQQENQSINKVVRRLFELQIELEQMNRTRHEYVYEVRQIIQSVDDLFERLMNKVHDE
ncbi:MAG: hypothetical protein AB8B56_13605 [Crocinitomicaceae bacterium]